MARNLNAFLHPRSIAFVGGAECDVAIRRSLELGFEGRIWAVHPKRDQLGGVPAVRSVEAIDGPIDAAFVAVKREPTVDVVRALRAKGCGGAVIYAAGFAEAGDHALHDALMAAADGMPLVGPNCYGFVNALSRAALWPDEHGLVPRDSGVAIITQSGNIACNLTMTRRELPLALICAIGNQADVDMAQLVTALAEDERITAIGLHIEGLRDVIAFSEAARRARELRKPLVVLKTGRSEQGARVTLSHTSSLAGADTLYDALFQRYGIARVDTVSAFVETLKFLHLGGPLADARLVSMSCSGGEAALAADLALGRGVSFPPFDPATRESVAATLNEFVAIDNPLDYHTFIWGQPDKLEATFIAVLGGGFDVSMLILDTPTHPRMNPASWLVTARAFQRAAAATGARAAVVASLAEGMPDALAAELAAAGVAPLIGLDDAITVFEAAARIGRNWAQGESPPALQSEPDAGGNTVVLGEYDAKQFLARHGLRVPEGAVCAAGDAVALARRIGFPVTLKVSSSTIAHKTEAGGVALNLRDEAAVAAAAQHLGALAPDLLVERMVEGAVAELIIGLTRDPQFGTALVIGAGGILAELLKDTVTLLLPATRAEIEAALRGLRVWTLVEGFRGSRGDARAAVDAIEAIARFAHAHRGRIEELDVNPLLVCSDGAIAVDALLTMRTP
jgi:acyl-CoA synthetase (NDP forming)